MVKTTDDAVLLRNDTWKTAAAFVTPGVTVVAAFVVAYFAIVREDRVQARQAELAFRLEAVKLVMQEPTCEKGAERAIQLRLMFPKELSEQFEWAGVGGECQEGPSGWLPLETP
jgi:hypothetical protein